MDMTRKRLTGRQHEILDILRKADGWLDRAGLAAGTGKEAISPHDVHLLEDLATQGYIEVGSEPIPTPRKTKVVYRIKSSDGPHTQK